MSYSRVHGGILLSDGERIAVGYEAYDSMYLLEQYRVTDLSFHTDLINVMFCDGVFNRQITTGQRIEFTISSYGKCSSVPFNEGMKLFRNADSLSVNELLALAFQKMEARQASP